MKRSNTGLFIIIGFVSLLIIVTIVGARVALGNIFGTTAKVTSELVTDGKDDRAVVRYDFSEFDEIAVAGAWTINITEGETYSVVVHSPESVKDLIAVKQKGKRLYFEDVFRFARFKSGTINADVTMPSLTSYQVDGAASVYIHGFDEERLDIEINGASTVRGENNVTDMLEVELNGAGQVDFGGSETKNADVDIDGVGTVTISITGGTLDGSINGLGTIKYYGEISENRIDIDGLGSVKKVE